MTWIRLRMRIEFGLVYPWVSNQYNRRLTEISCVCSNSCWISKVVKNDWILRMLSKRPGELKWNKVALNVGTSVFDGFFNQRASVLTTFKPQTWCPNRKRVTVMVVLKPKFDFVLKIARHLRLFYFISFNPGIHLCEISFCNSAFFKC